MVLRGKTILITRAAAQSEGLRSGLERLGANVVECPVSEIVPVEDWSLVDRAVADLGRYDWVLFTSANAVDGFMGRVKKAGAAVTGQVAVVGRATAERAEGLGLKVDVVPLVFRAEGLVDALPADLSGKRVLLPRAEEAREVLPETLRDRGAVVDVVTVYRTVKSSAGIEKLKAAMASGRVDCVVFTSPSGVRFFAEGLGEELMTRMDGVAVAVIGPVAGEAVEHAGLQVAIEPDRSTVEDLVEAIRKWAEPTPLKG